MARTTLDVNILAEEVDAARDALRADAEIVSIPASEILNVTCVIDNRTVIRSD